MKTLTKAFAASTLVLAGIGMTVPATAAPLNVPAAAATTYETAVQWNDMRAEHKRGKRHGHGRYDDDYGRRVYEEPVYRNTRVWEDDNGVVRCRKTDGTIGLIVGGAAGAILGREIDSRGDRSLGTILGAAGGAILGKQVMSRTRCR